MLSFYYRYLAAAKPLTDVVYGTEVSSNTFGARLSSIRTPGSRVWADLFKKLLLSTLGRAGAYNALGRPFFNPVGRAEVCRLPASSLALAKSFPITR